MLEYPGDDFDDIYMMTFRVAYTDIFGSTLFHDLKPNGDEVPVTKDNKKVSRQQGRIQYFYSGRGCNSFTVKKYFNCKKSSMSICTNICCSKRTKSRKYANIHIIALCMSEISTNVLFTPRFSDQLHLLLSTTFLEKKSCFSIVAFIYKLRM